MQAKYIGLGAVVIAAAAIISYKTYLPKTAPTASHEKMPRVLLVANLAEANETGDACADMIRLVRAAHDRGIAVQEVDAGSKSPLISKYHVLTSPTVLIFDRHGKEVLRLQGEGGDVVRELRTRLAQLK